ncbi:MAG: ogr/Delta-like zinc finger family protein [Azoarcus sp.]|jgi:hypothetical protein|nr:ogr/Delta-like zinc finger family protein [Azoarcus sp.]
MKINCPHCGQRAKIRTSRDITPLTREAYLQCENPECFHSWKVIVSATATIQPSLHPNPDVFVPNSTRAAGNHSKDKDDQQQTLL